MSESKHTPGPWMFSDNGRLPIGVASPHRTWKDKAFTSVATVGGDIMGGQADFETKLADARLIAAAPDLLETLKRLVKRHDANANDVEPGFTCGCVDCQEAEAAIAKAEGR